MTDYESFIEASKMLEDASITPVDGHYWFVVDADGAWHPLSLGEAEAMEEDLRRRET